MKRCPARLNLLLPSQVPATGPGLSLPAAALGLLHHLLGLLLLLLLLLLGGDRRLFSLPTPLRGPLALELPPLDQGSVAGVALTTFALLLLRHGGMEAANKKIFHREQSFRTTYAL